MSARLCSQPSRPSRSAVATDGPLRRCCATPRFQRRGLQQEGGTMTDNRDAGAIELERRRRMAAVWRDDEPSPASMVAARRRWTRALMRRPSTPPQPAAVACAAVFLVLSGVAVHTTARGTFACSTTQQGTPGRTQLLRRGSFFPGTVGIARPQETGNSIAQSATRVPSCQSLAFLDRFWCEADAPHPARSTTAVAVMQSAAGGRTKVAEAIGARNAADLAQPNVTPSGDAETAHTK